jgi:hypothetical protein
MEMLLPGFTDPSLVLEVKDTFANVFNHGFKEKKNLVVHLSKYKIQNLNQ